MKILCVLLGFSQGMPDDIAGGYDPVGDMWVSSEDSDTEIKSGCGVRLRIIGVTVGAELVRREKRKTLGAQSARLSVDVFAVVASQWPAGGMACFLPHDEKRTTK